MTLEGRCCLISAFLFPLAVYISGFDLLVSLIVITISSIFTSGKSVRILRIFLPLYVFFAATAVFYGVEHALKSALAFTAIICSGALIYATSLSEVMGALLYFKIPERIVSVLSLAIAMFPIFAADFMNIRFVHRSYRAMLKSLAATAVLRSTSFSESLYSKNFSYRAVYELRKPNAKDYALLTLSLTLFSLI